MLVANRLLSSAYIYVRVGSGGGIGDCCSIRFSVWIVGSMYMFHSSGEMLLPWGVPACSGIGGVVPCAVKIVMLLLAR